MKYIAHYNKKQKELIMTETKAREIICSYYLKKPYWLKTIKRLMDWDESKTAGELQKILKIKSPFTIYRLAKHFGLFFKKSKTHIGQFDSPEEKIRIQKLIDLGFNQNNIAKVYGMSRQRIHQVLGKNWKFAKEKI